MAMGGTAQREVTSAIANCRQFKNSTGSMRGTKGPTRELGWLSNRRDKALIRELLSRATYVVWSYDTPIGCVTEDDDGNVTKVYFDENHTVTTSHHQTLCRVGFSDFETVGEGPWTRGQRRAVRARSEDRASVPVRVRYDDGSLPGARQGSSADRYRSAAHREQDALIDEVRGYRAPHHP